VNARRRLDDLERRARLHKHGHRPGPAGSGSRARMVEHLDRVAALRRGELGPKEAAEVEAMSAAAESRFASRRGEGRR
jgi:hypothetical protein